MSLHLWYAADDDVIAWTLQHYLNGGPTGEFAVTTGEDLELLVVAAADQVREHHDPVHGRPEHLITRLAIWPIAGSDDRDVILTIAPRPQPPKGRWRLALTDLSISAFTIDSNDARVTIPHALTHVLVQARLALKEHQAWKRHPVIP